MGVVWVAGWAPPSSRQRHIMEEILFSLKKYSFLSAECIDAASRQWPLIRLAALPETPATAVSGE